jgi:Bacterial Ig domain
MLRFSRLLILLLSCIILSCDPEETPDTAAPEITIVSPTENQRVKGTITITATAQDRETAVTMQVFLDEKLTGESTTGEITVQTDTKTLTEGGHTIKITATDVAGNTGVKTLNVEVRNILFKVEVPSNYDIPEHTQIYFALSKNDGSIIAVRQIEKASTIAVPTPADFNPDSSFVYIEYFYLDETPNGFHIRARSMNTYAGLNAGEFKLPGTVTPVRSVVGKHQIEITEVPINNYRASLFGKNLSGAYGAWGASGKIVQEVSMYSNTSDLYFTLTEGTGEPVYNYISNIQVDGSTHFSYTGLPQLPKMMVATRDAGGTYICDVTNTAGDLIRPLSFYYKQGAFGGGKIPVYYPASIYPQYVFYLQYFNGIHSYDNKMQAAAPPTSFQYLNAAASSVNYTNRQLKVTSTGTFDAMYIVGGGSTSDNTSLFLDTYSVQFPNGNRNKVIIPNIPSELASLGFTPPTDFTFEYVSFYDYLTLFGLNDYQNKVVFSSDNVARQNRNYIGILSPITTTSSGGRLSKTEKVTLPKQLEAALRNHLPEGIRNALLN